MWFYFFQGFVDVVIFGCHVCFMFVYVCILCRGGVEGVVGLLVYGRLGCST